MTGHMRGVGATINLHSYSMQGWRFRYRPRVCSWRPWHRSVTWVVAGKFYSSDVARVLVLVLVLVVAVCPHPECVYTKRWSNTYVRARARAGRLPSSGIFRFVMGAHICSTGYFRCCDRDCLGDMTYKIIGLGVKMQSDGYDVVIAIQ